MRYHRVARARELRAAQLEMELARAQVEALKMQLHPHFLFNTLNTVAGLMRDDPDAAELMLAKLAELLRRTFETADVQELPLDEELEFIEAYLTIQRLRYGDRLRVSIDVSDAVRQARFQASSFSRSSRTRSGMALPRSRARAGWRSAPAGRRGGRHHDRERRAESAGHGS